MIITLSKKHLAAFAVCLFMALSAEAQVPVVKFTANKLVIEQYESVQLFDSSTNNPIEWEWNVYDSTTYASSSFYPNLANGDVYSDPWGSGNDEFSKNPEFAFDLPGFYTVTLRCRNSSGWSTVLVKKGYIECVLPTQYNIGYGTYGKNNDNIVDSKSGTVFDDGGPNLNYSHEQGLKTRSYLLIRPCKAKKIILKMTQLKFADTTDVLYVYDGAEEDITKRLVAWTKNNTGNRTVTATSGSMYIIFKSGVNGADSGFAGSYTTELDTNPGSPGLDIIRAPEVYNSTPITFHENDTDLSGTPTWEWTIDNYQVPQNTKPFFRYTFFTDGKYKVCVKANHCFGSIKVCDTIDVITPTKKTKLNFTKSATYATAANGVVLTPVTDNANRFYWTITPKSWTLLSPLPVPSVKDSTTIKYQTTPGDSIPTPVIRFLDTVCYTIKLVAFNSLNPTATADTLIKTNYICGYDFRDIFGIYGRVYQDRDADCRITGVDRGLSGIGVRIYDSLKNYIGYTTTAIDGWFFVEETDGKFIVEPDLQGMPFKNLCSNRLDTFIKISKQSPLNGLDYMLGCDPKYDLMAKTITPRGWVFPGRTHVLDVTAGLKFSYGNICYTSAADSGYIKVKMQGKIKNVSIPQRYSIPDEVTGTEFTFKVRDFNNDKINIRFSVTMDTTATASDSVDVEVEIKSYGKEKDTTNNKKRRFYRVVNSYDPNMKEVYPEHVKPGFSDWLTYTIHFQNTGTAPAFNIRLEDTLDGHLDLETFDVVEASHQYRVSLKKNILKFYFDDIMLSDSTSDRKGSEGHVTYRVKPLKDLPKGTRIHNTAYIYFDYNKAIVTNTTLNEFVQETSIDMPGMPGLKIYPNPGKGLYRLETGGSTGGGRIEVYNAMGFQVMSDILEDDQQLDIRKYPDGMYILRIYINGRVAVVKLIKGSN